MPDVPSADCARNDAEGERHAFIPILSDAEHPTLESVNRLAHEYELRELPGRYVGIAAAWNWCASADRRCSLSITQEASRSIA